MLRSALAALTGLSLLLAGCGSAPTRPSGAAASTSATTPTAPADQPPPRPGQPPPNVLAAEVTWMKQLFEGTPVAIAGEDDGSMRVDVPLTFSFDDKSNAPKPPLRAVMDKVAQTLARQPSAKVHVGTPGPAARTTAMRNYLIGRGVVGLRVVALNPPPGDGVTLRVVPGPIAIDKLDDKALPAPGNAFPANRGSKS
ncbi:MAG TPA: hypothetical protein VML58_18230 [Burkholderiaceae bacterium]|nr:hypothetical protein [Burkholderiaceae bacterium]